MEEIGIFLAEMQKSRTTKGNGAFNIKKFINLVKNRPAIYNLKDPDHHNRIHIDKMWLEISQEMNKSVLECKVKWHQLRNNFARELRHEKGLLSKKRVPWHLKASLEFLRHHITKSLRYNKRTTDHAAKSNKFDLNDEVIGKTEIIGDNYSADEYTNYLQMENVKQNSNSDSMSHCSQENPDHIVIEDVRTDDSSDLIFFKSLLPDIRKLSSRKKRKLKEVVLVTLNRLLDADEEEEN